MVTSIFWLLCFRFLYRGQVSTGSKARTFALRFRMACLRPLYIRKLIALDVLSCNISIENNQLYTFLRKIWDVKWSNIDKIFIIYYHNSIRLLVKVVNVMFGCFFKIFTIFLHDFRLNPYAAVIRVLYCKWFTALSAIFSKVFF